LIEGLKMAGIGGCRSSGTFTADKIIFKGRGKLISIHGMAVGTSEAYVEIYDNTSASGTVIGTLYVGGTAPTTNAPASAEADMHGVIFQTGLYADVTHVTNTDTMFTIEFS
jgi:hypothetical protein